MREILFKAKRINNGEWVQGWYMETFTGSALIVTLYDHILGMIEKYEVDSQTLSQFTGLKDKNGNKIFEGDRLSLEDIGEEGYEYKEGYDFTNYASIYFDDEECGFRLKDFFEDDNSAIVNGGLKDEPLSEIIKGSEIVGNKFDNPELLTKE